MTSLQGHLVAAAVEDGDVPRDVAVWVDAGASPLLAEHDEDSYAARAARWEITDQGAATWAMRKLAAAQAEAARILEQYDREKKRLDAWLVRATRPHANTSEFMQDRLERWALAQREANPKQATFHTPAGSVETRVPSSPWKVEVADKEALLQWALANQRDDLIRPTLATVTEIRKRVALSGPDGETPEVWDVETGEAVPGLTVEPTRPTVIVRPEVD